MITKTLRYNDPLIHNFKAEQAERAGLRKQQVWKEDQPVEYADAVKLYPDALLAKLFSITGIKHYDELGKTLWK